MSPSPAPPAGPPDGSGMPGFHGRGLGGGQIPPSVAFLLSRLGYQAGAAMGEALGELGLEVRQFGLLRLLASSQGSSQRALGEMLRITPNRMVALVDGLESKGLIERRTHPEDRRAYTLTLTEAGAAALRRGINAGIGVEMQLCAPLALDERAQLLSLLGKLASANDERTGGLADVHPGMLAPDDGPTPHA